MKKKQIIENIIGLAALVLCVAVFVISGHHDAIFNKDKYITPTEISDNEKVASGIITVPGDLEYDGSGKLDLMKGITADDGNGKDMTSEVTAVLTSDGSLNKKVVRYSFTDANGDTITAKRYLVMKKYKGPAISVEGDIVLDAKDLNDIINVLKESNGLVAYDGFGNDITDKVSCVREKVSSRGYNIIFTVVNPFSDSVTVTKPAVIRGNVEDPSLRLNVSRVNLRVGDVFDPMSIVTSAFDGTEENPDLLKVESTVDTETAGEYVVDYTMYSSDRTSVARASVNVTVTEDKR